MSLALPSATSSVDPEAPKINDYDRTTVEPTMTVEANSDVYQEGLNTAATAFIRGLLDFAVEDYTEEDMHEVFAHKVLMDPEPAVSETDEDVLLDDCEDSLDAEVVLSASDGEDNDEDNISVASLDLAAATDVALDHEAIAAKMATDIVSMSQVAAEASIIKLLAASTLAPCTRRKFQRQAPPRHLPPMEDPFPLDCLPLSAPVARSMPPSAELAALRAVPPPRAFEEALAPQPLASSTMPEAMARPLSGEAQERLLRSAADGLEALWMAARLEAAQAIQKQWRMVQAQRQLLNAKISLAASPIVVAGEAVATFRMDAADDAGGAAQREASVAGVYAALDAEVYNISNDSDGEANPRCSGPTAPRAPPCRPTTAPTEAVAVPTAPPGSPPTGRGDPRRRNIGLGARMVPAPAAGVTIPGGFVPTPPPPRRPSTQQMQSAAPPQTPRTSRPGARLVPTSVEGAPALVPHPPSKPLGPSTGGRRPGKIDGHHALQATLATNAASSGAPTAPLAPVRPPATPRTPRPAMTSNRPVTPHTGSSLTEAIRCTTPGPSRDAEPAATAPSAMELDLGLPFGATGGTPEVVARPASRGRSLFAGAETPRISKSVGTGLLPALSTKVTKNGPAGITWTLGPARAMTPRTPNSSRIDRGVVF